MSPSVKEWSPDPLRDMLEILDVYTADSSRYGGGNFAIEEDTGKMMGVAIPFVTRGAFPEAGFESYHVTDDPEPVRKVLEEGGDLMKTQKYWFGRMCPGLYVSTSTAYWTRSVSSKRYAFLNEINQDQRALLGQIILQRLALDAGTGYISRGEYDAGVRDVTYWITGANPAGINMVLGQPFNINAPELAVKLGIIDKVREPEAVKVSFRGRYLRFEDREAIDTAYSLARFSRNEENVTQKEVCLALAFHGWDGMYTKSGFSTEAELVILNGAKIDQFGEFVRT